jgi:putative transposase
MKRRKSLSVIERNEALLFEIKKVKTDHPLWGYRRIWSYLKYRQGIKVNKKRIYRLMKEHNLMVTPDVRLKARRGPMRPKPHAEYPNHFWGIDMTKIRMTSWGWLYLVVVLDWYTKEIIGYSLGLQSKTEDWLKALNIAVNNRFPQGIKESIKDHLFLLSDNGCQPTSQRFMMNCALLGVKQIFTTWSNPKGNSDTERVLRTLKEDLVWPYDWDNPFDFEVALNKWIESYNTDYPHQSLGNLTPEQYHLAYVNKELCSNLKTA